MIVVTTPTGQIGSQLVPHLLAAGERVRVIARDPTKLSRAVRDTVDVVVGNADDPAVIDRAFTGAESVFWVVPPNFRTTDVTAYYLSFTRPAIDAIKKHGVKRVVSVSSLGRHLGRKAGVIDASHAKDALFETSGAAFRGLWCPGFMENMLRNVPTLKAQGAFFMAGKPDLAMPHAATRDIAASGARLLLDKTWTGTGGLAVLGPEDLTLDAMAAIMTDVLGAPIHYQQVPAASIRDAMLSRGATAAMADGLIEMTAAIDQGLYNAERRTPENTTPTSFRQWCTEVLKPAFLAT
ncbi:MAG TPA: NAD(P)H-binding protein [Kofleriaceae bacterium]|jgi:uncharacterized protein YbjT (DUF2867 family)